VDTRWPKELWRVQIPTEKSTSETDDTAEYRFQRHRNFPACYRPQFRLAAEAVECQIKFSRWKSPPCDTCRQNSLSTCYILPTHGLT